MINLLLSLIGIGGRSLQTWQEERKLKAEKRLEIERLRVQGEIDQAKALAQTVAEYDNIAQRNMKFTFKDEYLMMIFTFPYIISFVTPYIQAFAFNEEGAKVDLINLLDQSWSLITKVPDWWQWCTIGMVVATYGLRWMWSTRPGRLFRDKTPTPPQLDQPQQKPSSVKPKDPQGPSVLDETGG